MTGRAVVWLAATAVLGFEVVGCGGSSAPSSGSAEATKAALDPDARVSYQLTGDRLRVEVLSDAPRFEDLFLGRGPFTFRCTNEPHGSISDAPAQGTGEFSPDTRVATVFLTEDISEDVLACFAQAPGGAVESRAWFVSPQEIYGFGELPEKDKRANEQRAREATDCVEFTKNVLLEYTGQTGPGEILSPGDPPPPAVPIQAYWFGPVLDDRRAILAEASMQPDYDAAEREVDVPTYWTIYQRPEDWCLSSFLHISSDEDLGFNAGREIQVGNESRESPTAQLYLRDPEVLGHAPHYRTRLSNGERVTVYPGSVMGFTVLTETTLVTVPDHYRSAEDTRRLLPLLRPVGG